jgi:hypothetical protein
MRTKSFRVMAVTIIMTMAISFGATAYKWTGAKEPCKLTTPKTGRVGIGEFINLGPKEDWGQVAYNIAPKFPGSTPWLTWGVGAYTEHKTPLTDIQHEEIFAYLDGIGVQVYLEVRPGSADVSALIDTYMTKFKKHACIKGFGVDLEFWHTVTDADAKKLDDKLKTYNPDYRLFFKHWETGYMPPTYRGKGDLIFISTSSESPPAELIKGHAAFANHFGTGATAAACAFQIGYPADEPLGDNHTYGGVYDGWSKMADPIKEWGDALLKAVTSPTQELGMIWVTVKSDRFAWDLTKGAIIPTTSIAFGVPKLRGTQTEPQGTILSFRNNPSLMPLSVATWRNLTGQRIVGWSK